MNKYQKKRYKMFQVWYPMACKNNKKVNSANRNKRYRKFVWSYSNMSIKELNEELELYRTMDSLMKK